MPAITDLLIDATSLGDDSAYRGIGTYLRHLLSGLADVDELSARALVRRARSLPSGIAPAPTVRAAPGRLRRVEHNLLLALDLMLRDRDVFHSPALDPPRRCAGPWVQTLHDVIPLVFDDPELAEERWWWRRHVRRYRQADVVIAISRHTANEGIAILGLDPSRIEVVPHGVSPEFQPPRHRRRADPPYLLSVGEYSRRKGYAEAFEVAGALAELGYPHALRVAGRIVPWVRPTLERLLAAAPRSARIELLGYVEDLAAQYARASLLLCTSRYEGFGLPLLEAMACGTPVVAFDNSAIPEVVGDAGLLVPDGDVSAMVAAARSLLDDPQRWSAYARRGLERARRFTWERSVRMHVEAYRRAISARNARKAAI